MAKRKPFFGNDKCLRYDPSFTLVSVGGQLGHVWVRWIRASAEPHQPWIRNASMFFKQRETRQTIERGFVEQIG
jgi:hypothetical protein